MSQLQEGTYPATGRSIAISESSKGAIMLNITFQLEDGSTVVARQCLVQTDGTVSTITLNMLRECFDFTGPDPFVLVEDPALMQKPVELVFAYETYKDKERLAVKFINPPGGGAGSGKPVDRASFLQKFGSKLRAMQGGVAAKPPTAPKLPPKPPTPTPPPKPPAPKKAFAPSTMDEAWAELYNNNQGMDEEKLNVLWTELLDHVKPGHQNDLTAEQWGEVKHLAQDDIKY